MAFFDGSQIFGYCLSCETTDHPRDRQENSYAGVSGIESIDLGGRGKMTTIRGILYGDSIGDLAIAENTMRSYNDGNAYVFVDNFGVAYDAVKLDQYRPTGRVFRMAFGGYGRKYDATFRHLI